MATAGDAGQRLEIDRFAEIAGRAADAQPGVGSEWFATGHGDSQIIERSAARC
jgi:hypothetical protein